MNIVMITDYRMFLRQGIKQYLSMDKEKLKKSFIDNGINVFEYTYEEIINKNIDLYNQYIIYTSSQSLTYKGYIDDILYSLSKNNILLPSYDIFKAHENKGFQEILKRDIGINSLGWLYFGGRKGLKNNLNLINEYPVILKKLYGAGSSNVHMVNSQEQLIKLVEKMNKPQHYKTKTIKKFVKKYVLQKKHISKSYQDDDFVGPFIVQEFMKGLTEDWKVLVFGSKFYVLNRKIQENDFRASGSGKLFFLDPPKEVLDYAKNIFEKLDIPFVSLDIAYNGDHCELIEFQGTHFGPYTLVYSNFYYEFVNGEWKKIEENSILEEEYAKSITNYIHNKLV